MLQSQVIVGHFSGDAPSRAFRGDARCSSMSAREAVDGSQYEFKFHELNWFQKDLE